MAVALYDLTHLPGIPKLAVIGVTFALSNALGYWQIYIPYLKRRDAHFKTLMDVAVDNFLSYCRDVGISPEAFRINMMIARRRHRAVGRKQLQMVYEYGDYHQAERKLVYDVGSGNCGIAFETNSSRLFNRGESAGHLDLFRLTPEQDKITENVNSVLSIPVYGPDDSNKTQPIGIVNVDSVSDMEDTGFRDNETLTNAMRLATFAGIVFG